MRIFPRPRLFSVSPWLLAAATALLVLIIVTFSLSNVRREERLMTNSMLKKADTLIQVIHSGARSAYFSDLQRGVWRTDPWQKYVQHVINHVAEDPDVMFLALVDDTSKVIAHDNKEKIGQTLDFVLPSSPPEGRSSRLPIGYRIAREEDSGRVFEAVRSFYPYRSFLHSKPHAPLNRRLSSNQLNQRGMVLRRMLKESGSEYIDDRNYYLLVGLDMSAYDQSLKSIKLQTAVLALIMLLVGLGGWLSLATVQGYRASQRTLDEMKQFTGLLLARLPVGIIATDSKGFITTFNETAADMTGLRTEDVMGKNLSVLPDVFGRLLAGAEGAVSDAQSRATGEKEVSVVKNGNEQHYLCHRIEFEGKKSEQQGQVLLISDLTQLKSLEKEMRENERLAAVGRMAAGVAHEVRNPLSSIKGLALLLKNKFGENSNDREAADLLIDQVERMNRTVSELLSFARPAPLQLQRTALKGFLNDTLRFIEMDASNNGIATRLETAADLNDIAADKDRLNQVFINLFLNSIQAMEKGGELFIKAENGNDGSKVVVTIRDNGCGIPSENIAQLCYPYFTTKTGGTGIGLAISQKIINDHKGTLRIDSVEGKGTTVTLEFPAFSNAGMN